MERWLYLKRKMHMNTELRAVKCKKLQTLYFISIQGRPTEASAEAKIKEYGELEAKDYIPGAEVLEEEANKEEGEDEGKQLFDQNVQSSVQWRQNAGLHGPILFIFYSRWLGERQYE